MIAVILNSVIMGIANVVMIVQSLQAIVNDTVRAPILVFLDMIDCNW